MYSLPSLVAVQFAFSSGLLPPVKTGFAQFEVNPQLFNGYWTVEETWDGWGYVFYSAWEIRGDTGRDNAVLQVEAAAYDGTQEVVRKVNGTGRIGTMSVSEE